jgi:Fe-S cluster assembly protein SufD
MNRLPTDKLRDIVGRLPTTRDEDWKYTDLSRARDITSRWLDAGGETVAAEIAGDIAGITASIDATWFVIANGELHSPGDAPGVSAKRLDTTPVADTALAELNTALLRDGLSLVIEGKPEKPVGLLFIDGAAEAAASQAYVEVKFAANSAGELIEYHASLGAADHYANAIIDIAVGDNADAKHVRIQDRDLNHVQTARTVVNVGRNARFSSAGFDLGGGLVRNDIVINIAHPGAAS